jgi:hypothetical protein
MWTSGQQACYQCGALYEADGYLVVLGIPWYFLHDVLHLDHQVVAMLFQVLDSFLLSQRASHLLLKAQHHLQRFL